MTTQRPSLLPLVFVLLLGFVLFHETNLAAQEIVRAGSDDFAPSRAVLLDSAIYAPFEVSGSRALREALAQGLVQAQTRLLVMDHANGRLALVADQMAYHHTAQGELEGEPWMVSFCSACDSGIGMTPLVDGVVHHFEYRGVFNGGSLLRDRETGSYWHHVSGMALAGPLKGRRLPVFNVLQGTVDQVLEADSTLQVALSNRPIRRRSRWAPLTERVPILPERLKATIRGEDPRRESMDIGLGTWTEGAQTYYPLSLVEAEGRFVFDVLDDRRLLVHIEPTSNLILGFYTEATGAEWEGDVLHLDDGTQVRSGALYDASGAEVIPDRPMQVFTRWYGFSLTFPEVEVYKP